MARGIRIEDIGDFCKEEVEETVKKTTMALHGKLRLYEAATRGGIGTPEELHPMQAAFKACHGLQCGFCTPGMIMSAIDLVNRSEDLDETAIREGLEGNICRCTGYHNIVKAVTTAAEEMGGKS